MSETIGYVDDQGSFRLETTFDPRRPSDMEKMSRLFGDEETNARVVDYGPDFVKVVYRPDVLTQHGL
jgi:hypothetical protein